MWAAAAAAAILLPLFILIILQQPSLALTSPRTPLGQTSLYDPAKDFVVSVNASTFGSIFERDQAFLLEFYASWCGHCQYFAPYYKALARETRFWRPVIVVAAINCAHSANAATCRLFNIHGYPTMKFFPAQARLEHRGSLVQAHSVSNDLVVPWLAREMVDFVVMHPEFDRPASWPDMPTNLTNSAPEDGWGEIESALTIPEVERVAIVFGQAPVTASVFLARSVALDLSQLGDTFRVFAVHDAGSGDEETAPVQNNSLSSMFKVDVQALPAIVFLSSPEPSQAVVVPITEWFQHRDSLVQVPEFQYSHGRILKDVEIGSLSPNEGGCQGVCLFPRTNVQLGLPIFT